MSESTGVDAALSAADIDGRYQPARQRARICLDSELVLDIERLEDELDEAQHDDTAASPAGTIAARIIELREQAQHAEAEFVFHSIGRLAYRDLKRAHPPTDEQKKEAEEAGYESVLNGDTFFPALLAASCEQPTGTDLAWWTEKCKTWSDGQINPLVAAARAAQEGVSEVPKAARAYALTRTPNSNSG